ncbi:MAG TPA: BrnT family toxin [Bryobacteraceae bacterium]|nr:BrnT family toxin [Bryobacteraceae bacterium]
MSLVFEWDPPKARSNYRKHGISFAEAVSVFSNPLARIFPDEEHSAGESREIIIGHSAARRLLLVCFSEPEADRIRIIGARRATRVEQHDYEEDVAK